MPRVVEVDRFRAISDAGKEYILIVYQSFIPTPTRDDPHGEIEGMKSLFTSTGLHVNYIDSKTFKIVETNEIVRKV
jgi:hypothetical protein